jgi:hypothetical protein
MVWPPEVTILAAGITGIMTGAALGIYYGKAIGESIGFEAAKFAYSYKLFGDPNKPATIGGMQAQQAGMHTPYGGGGGGGGGGAFSGRFPGAQNVSITSRGGGGGGGSGSLEHGLVKSQNDPIAMTPAQRRAVRRLYAEELSEGMQEADVEFKKQLELMKRQMDIETARMNALGFKPNPIKKL